MSLEVLVKAREKLRAKRLFYEEVKEILSILDDLDNGVAFEECEKRFEVLASTSKQYN